MFSSRNLWRSLGLLVGSLGLVSGNVQAYEPVTFETIRLTVDANEGIDVADVDRDGKLDIIAGRNWYRAPNFVPHPLRSLEDWNGYTTSNGDFAYDVNGDGWPDLIAGGFLETEIYWFENPREQGLKLGQQWKKHLLVDTKLSQNEANLFTDLDGDGKPELVVNSWNNANPLCAWKLSTREETQTKKGSNNQEETVTVTVPGMERWLIGQRGNGHGMAIGDLNNDGRVDILVGDGWFEQPAENAATQPWIYRADWTGLRAAVPCVVYDVNQDGKNDLIWAKGHDYGIYWWEITGQNDDGSLEWKEHLIDDSLSQAHALVMADIDGDGQLELITGKRYRAHNDGDPGAKDTSVLVYYKWDQEQQKFHRYSIETTGKVGIGLQIRVADLNNDGLLDIAVAGKSGTHVLINKGQGKTEK